MDWQVSQFVFSKIWGYEGFVKRLRSDKLAPKLDKCIFVGYPKDTLGYYVYNRSEGKVFIARNGVFLEKEFLKGEKSGRMVQLEKWQDAMKSEIESMKENQVWNLIDPPDGVRTIECKWIYKKKKDIDGNVHIYKARLVAKGFRQVQGVDYSSYCCIF